MPANQRLMPARHQSVRLAWPQCVPGSAYDLQVLLLSRRCRPRERTQRGRTSNQSFDWRIPGLFHRTRGGPCIRVSAGMWVTASACLASGRRGVRGVASVVWHPALATAAVSASGSREVCLRRDFFLAEPLTVTRLTEEPPGGWLTPLLEPPPSQLRRRAHRRRGPDRGIVTASASPKNRGDTRPTTPPVVVSPQCSNNVPAARRLRAPAHRVSPSPVGLGEGIPTTATPQIPPVTRSGARSRPSRLNADDAHLLSTSSASKSARTGGNPLISCRCRRATGQKCQIASRFCPSQWRPGVSGRPHQGEVLTSATGIDEAKLKSFMWQAVTDVGAVIGAPLMVIGEKLGLYKALAHAGPLTSQQVAERSVREWIR
jgi:hypothetical protein